MDIKDAKILWKIGGPVKVIPMGQEETPDEQELSKSYGACNAEWVQANDDRRMVLMLAAFLEMVIYDGVSLKEAHEAFLAIDQYRRGIGRED